MLTACIVLPTLNEAKNIERIIPAIFLQQSRNTHIPFMS